MKTVHLTDNIVITRENILDLGKAIALKAVKGSLRYAYGNIDYLHKDIINDLYHHNTMDNYSDGFDIVQETVCFLCHFIGHKLGGLCCDMTILLLVLRRCMPIFANKLK